MKRESPHVLTFFPCRPRECSAHGPAIPDPGHSRVIEFIEELQQATEAVTPEELAQLSETKRNAI